MTQHWTATYRDGQFVPDEPVHLSEGQRVYVVAVSEIESPATNDSRPEEAGWDDPVEVQAKIARLQALEPVEMSDDEIRQWETFREQVKQYTIEKMRTQPDFDS